MKNPFKKTHKFDELIDIYKKIAKDGCYTVKGDFVEPDQVFGMSGQYRYRDILKENFKKFDIQTILDYGSGQGSWDEKINATNLSLKEFLGLKKIEDFEPARNKTSKIKSDCVVSFDVLEHIFISDVPWVVHDMFSYAEKLVFVNVACYSASKMISKKDNAHITIRPPLWWKGIFDCIGSNFPDVNYVLLASKSINDVAAFEAVSHNEHIKRETYSALKK